MRSAVTIFLSLVLAGAILTGCSESRKPHQDIPQQENSSSVYQDTAAGEAETVFTEELLKSVEMADIDDFQPSMAGSSISDGGTANIIFGVRDGVLAINGINY